MEPTSHIFHTARGTKAIETLLDRVRELDKEAKARLAVMLDDERDLPYLDMMEREYAKIFKQHAPDKAVELRGRFVWALNEQRTHLIGQVRKVLQESDENGSRFPPDAKQLDQ